MQTVSGAAEITPADTAWTEGWYVVSGEVTIETRVAVTGDVHLILADGCHLTVSGGIGLQGENTNLTIYAQSEGEKMGALIATAGGEFDNDAGIGSNESGACGNITINGGTVTATNEVNGAGIGSSAGGICTSVVINGGIIAATSEGQGAGIGSGTYGTCASIAISGGIVTATSEKAGAGIGSGQFGTCTSIAINGGIVDASSEQTGAGIGSGGKGTCASITISGGIVTATSEAAGAGIGSGYYGTCSSITITGGTVSATGDTYGDGIGNGNYGNGASFSTGPNGNAVIYAASGTSSGQAIVGMEDKTGWRGIFFLNNDENGLFCGETVQLTADFEIPEGKNLAIGENQTLVIPAGVTITVIGKIQNNGRIICYGVITGEENISGNAVIYPQPEPEPTPEEPEEAEEETFIPSEPISDGLHKYSMGTMLYRGGKRVKGLTEYENATYYFDQSGWMQTGWVEFDGGWRYFAEDGRMVTGWLQTGGAWYYLDPETGIMYNDGPAVIGKSTYYFHDWGGMASDWWYEAEDGWYYFGGSGAMKSAQWLQWDGSWYYLTETGKMAVNADIGGYYVNADGVWVP